MSLRNQPQVDATWPQETVQLITSRKQGTGVLLGGRADRNTTASRMYIGVGGPRQYSRIPSFQYGFPTFVLHAGPEAVYDDLYSGAEGQCVRLRREGSWAPELGIQSDSCRLHLGAHMKLLNFGFVKAACLVSVLAFGSGSAMAAPIFEFSSGGLAVTGIFAGGLPLALDIRGAVSFLVSDTGLPPSLLAIYDSTGGTDPAAIVLPFSNSLLFADNGLGVFAQINFDFLAAVATGSRLVVPGTVTVGPGATGSLAAFAAASPLTFGFVQTGFVDTGAVQILQWQLTDLGIPEPSTYLLLSSGLVALGLMRRKFHQR